MPPQPARPTIRFAQAAGLTLFVATLAVLTALLITVVGSGFGSMQRVAMAFSTLCAVIATGAMLWDAIDLWLRGRRMTPYSVKMFRSMVFVAVLAALATSFLGRNSMLVILMLPAMIVYLFITRRPAPGAARPVTGAGKAGGTSAGRSGSVSASRSRQRRGGKKHK